MRPPCNVFTQQEDENLKISFMIENVGKALRCIALRRIWGTAIDVLTNLISVYYIFDVFYPVSHGFLYVNEKYCIKCETEETSPPPKKNLIFLPLSTLGLIARMIERFKRRGFYVSFPRSCSID